MPHALFSTSIGVCGIAWTDAGLKAFALPPVDADYFRERGASERHEAGSDVSEDSSAEPPAWIAALIGRVTRHLEGVSQDFGDVRYDFSRVTPFQREVYQAALQVKAGETRTYGWLAEQIGRGWPVTASPPM